MANSQVVKGCNIEIEKQDTDCYIATVYDGYCKETFFIVDDCLYKCMATGISLFKCAHIMRKYQEYIWDGNPENYTSDDDFCERNNISIDFLGVTLI